jgi:hypothetical protein
MGHIKAIEFRSTRVIDSIVTIDLPQAGQTRTTPAIVMEPATIPFYFSGPDRPRSNQTHIASKNIEELRQLVEATPPQELAECGHARIVFKLA